MISQDDLKFGDLFWVNFDPAVGHEFQGRRPAVVVQSNKQLRKSNLVTVLPLTSNLNNRINDDILVKKTTANCLKHDSIIKVYDVVSFDYSRFIKKIGVVHNKVMRQVRSYIKVHFGG